MNSRWHVLCARLEYPELIAVSKMAEPFQGGTVLIEDTPAGAPLTQKLQREGFARILAIKPQGDAHGDADTNDGGLPATPPSFLTTSTSSTYSLGVGSTIKSTAPRRRPRSSARRHRAMAGSNIPASTRCADTTSHLKTSPLPSTA